MKGLSPVFVLFKNVNYLGDLRKKYGAWKQNKIVTKVGTKTET